MCSRGAYADLGIAMRAPGHDSQDGAVRDKASRREPYVGNIETRRRRFSIFKTRFRVSRSCFRIVVAPLCTNRKKHAARLFYVLETISDFLVSVFRPAASTDLQRQPPPASHGAPTLSLVLRALLPRFALTELRFDLDARTADGH